MAHQINPKRVIGRDNLIQTIWQRLDKGQSLRFTAERRIGKTTVMQKMQEEAKSKYHIVYVDGAGAETPEYFVEKLFQGLRNSLSRLHKTEKVFKAIRKSIGGIEIAGMIKLPVAEEEMWQPALEKILEEVCRKFPDQRFVLMVDELPYMLQKMEETARKNKKPSPSLHVMDVLRSLRQLHANLTMVFCGSVGLHHVITELKSTGLSSEPVNDMPLIEIHPLEKQDALILADRLFREEGVEVQGDRSHILEVLVEETDGFPFYMERVSEKLAESGASVGPEQITSRVQAQLADDRDPWEMEHFRSRLKEYYPGDLTTVNGIELPRRKLAEHLLNHLALAQEPQSIDQVFSAATATFELSDRNVIITMLGLLAQDHYLISDERRYYEFRFTLVKRWWRLAQGLES